MFPLAPAAARLRQISSDVEASNEKEPWSCRYPVRYQRGVHASNRPSEKRGDEWEFVAGWGMEIDDGRLGKRGVREGATYLPTYLPASRQPGMERRPSWKE